MGKEISPILEVAIQQDSFIGLSKITLRNPLKIHGPFLIQFMNNPLNLQVAHPLLKTNLHFSKTQLTAILPTWSRKPSHKIQNQVVFCLHGTLLSQEFSWWQYNDF